MTQDVLAQSVARSLNEGCYRGSECVNLDIAQVTCDRGYTLVGYDKDKCQKSKVCTVELGLRLRSVYNSIKH